MSNENNKPRPGQGAPSPTPQPIPIQIPSGGEDFQRGLPPSESQPIGRPPPSLPFSIPSGGQERADGSDWVIPSTEGSDT